jgi:hypothetical protein
MGPISVYGRRQIPGTQTTEEITFSPDFQAKYDANQLWFAVEGKLTYEDVFGVKHWFTFCLANVNSSNLTIPSPKSAEKCIEYNDMDQH